MPVDPSSEPTRGQRLLRRLDQATVAALTLLALVALAGYWLAHGGLSGRLIEIDRVDPLTIHYQVDLNAADWPEFIALPEIGDTLAHRIVEYRLQNGPFKSVDDLRHVRRIRTENHGAVAAVLAAIKPPQVAEK